MTFAQAVRVCLQEKYCTFRGRASRSEFWWFSLCIGLINLGTGVLFAALPPTPAMYLSLFVSLSLLLPNIGVTVRRLHDRNLAGWWLLLPLGTLFFWLLGQAVPGDDAGALTALLSLSMCVCYLAILSLPGTDGPNRFGPDPLALRHPGAEASGR